MVLTWVTAPLDIGLHVFWGATSRDANSPFLVPFVPMFLQASWSTSQGYSSVIPRVLSVLLRYTCVRVLCCLRRVLLLRWPVLFHVSSWWRGCVRVRFPLRDGVLFPGVCHHEHLELCNHPWSPPRGRGEMALSPPRRACPFLHGGFVHFAQSVPQVRAVPSACSEVWS